MDEVLLVAGSSNPVIADFVAFASEGEKRKVLVVAPPNVRARIGTSVHSISADDFSQAKYLAIYPESNLSGMVIFLDRDMSNQQRELLEKLAKIAVDQRPACVSIVSTFLVHFGDEKATLAESFLLERLSQAPGKVVVFRPGYIVSPKSRLQALINSYRWLYLLIPSRFKTCSIEGAELFAAITAEMQRSHARKERTITLLGPNRSWSELVDPKAQGLLARAALVLVRTLLSVFLIGWLAGVLLRFAARVRPLLQSWNVATLYPTSLSELLGIYNKYNHRHVKVVGYNNGIVHFGHAYPGKTIVSTVRCNSVARVLGQTAQFDCGVTVMQARQAVAQQGKELPVMPNYSYVSLGTSYFIPIHGSASRYCTVGETIEQVVLYDPIEDRIVSTKRGNPAFGHYMYNLAADVLLLRLRVKIKEKSRYFVRHQSLVNPSSQEVLLCFHDDKPSNVEIRKSGAAAPTVKVSRYYTEVAEGDSTSLEVPRDALGGLWDRLEANPVSSVLFHGLTRLLAHHVELFLTEEEFAAFWDSHRSLAVSKIQLRYIKKDGFPNSPFRGNDCISADLFMLKKHRRTFETYLRETLPAVKLNPGKHSR